MNDTNTVSTYLACRRLAKILDLEVVLSDDFFHVLNRTESVHRVATIAETWAFLEGYDCALDIRGGKKMIGES